MSSKFGVSGAGEKGDPRLDWVSRHAESSTVPVLRVSKNGTLLYANEVGQPLLKRLGCEMGDQLPECICQLLPSVLRSGTCEDIEVECSDLSVVFTIAPRFNLPAPAGVGAEAPASGRPAIGEVIDSLPMAFYTAAPTEDLGRLWVSAGVERLLGYRPARFVEDPHFWASRFHPDDRWRVMRETRRLFTRGDLSMEYRLLCADGTYKWILDRAVLLRDALGKPTQIAGTMLDITGQKQNEERLRESSEFLETMVQNASHGVFVLTDKAAIAFLSASCQGLLGLRATDWVRGDTGLAIHPKDTAKAMACFYKALSGHPCRCDSRIRLADGSYRQLCIYLSRFAWRDQNFVLGVISEVNQPQPKGPAAQKSHSRPDARSN